MAKFIGLDVHDKMTMACLYETETQRVRHQRLDSQPEAIRRWVIEQTGGRCRVSLEAGPRAGLLYDQLVGCCQRVTVLDAAAMGPLYRQAGAKSDRRDSLEMALADARGRAPAVWMPKKEVRQWRSMIQHRRQLIGRRTRVKNEIRFLLKGQGVDKPHRGGWWTGKTRQWLEQLSGSQAELWQEQLANLLRELSSVNELVRWATERLDRRANRHPGVALLRTIKGIGPRTAEAVVAWIDQVDRFGRSRQAGKYFGLVPRLEQSGGRRRFGHISKQGPSVVRWLLVEAAWRVVRVNRRLKGFYERVRRGERSRSKIAVVAVARKLSEIMLAMLRDGTCFDEGHGARMCLETLGHKRS